MVTTHNNDLYKRQYLFALFGGLLALTAVLLGAFGAHALESRLPSEMLATFETAVRYQMYHALALLTVGMAGRPFLSQAAMDRVCIMLLAGILLFSGSLYLYIATGLSFMVFLTPVGGLLFILAWAALVAGVYKEYRTRVFQ